MEWLGPIFLCLKLFTAYIYLPHGDEHLFLPLLPLTCVNDAALLKKGALFHNALWTGITLIGYSTFN